jgi:voltage-gated potassium channel
MSRLNLLPAGPLSEEGENVVASMFLTVSNLILSIYSGFTDPAFRRLLLAAVMLLLSGTIAMNRIEGWALVDSFYFSVVSLTTVGYGDFTPETALGKLFTAFYVLGGIGVIVAFINALGERRIARATRSRTES